MKRYHSNGHLTIETEFKSTGGFRAPFLMVSLSCSHSGIEQIWSLGIRIKDTGSVYLPKGGRLLIKLDDGEVIELKQLMESTHTMYKQMVKLKNSEYTELKQSVERENKLCMYEDNDILSYVQGRYLITEDKIQKIASCHVTKVRVELDKYKEQNEYYKDYTNEEISEAVKTEYDEVLNAVQMGDNYIYMDF